MMHHADLTVGIKAYSRFRCISNLSQHNTERLLRKPRLITAIKVLHYQRQQIEL